MNPYHRLNSRLGDIFDQYVLENPRFAARIPRGAEVIFEVEGQAGFNSWQRSIWEINHEKGCPVVLVTMPKPTSRSVGARPFRPRMKKIATVPAPRPARTGGSGGRS